MLLGGHHSLQDVFNGQEEIDIVEDPHIAGKLHQ